ncbi:FAD/NAD(P)-binding domain-containing protein [Ramaria rubella]|nr:FAD/NAD(P)-binding domain-containing protein [Ramaria rubella]
MSTTMDSHFDVLLLGTGLTESITAAALAKAGLKVAHVDTNSYYGADQASLAHDELLQWSHSPPSSRYSNFSSSSEEPLPSSRSYSLSLSPALIPSAGPLITALILSGVSRYGQFKLLDAVYIHRDGGLKRVPGNKEDVFKARDVSLVDKRKLMRFLQFAAGEFEERPELEGQENTPLGDFMREKFSLGEEAREAIMYALAYCSSSSDPTLPALLRLRGYLRSAGRYGNSPFLVGHYGGLGELAQGFCRTCAVKGGVYILGRKIISLRLPSDAAAEAGRASIELENVPDVLTADLVITSQDYLTDSSLSQPDTRSNCACAIAIVDRPISFPLPLTAQPPREENGTEDERAASDRGAHPDTAVVVFPPGALPAGGAPNAVRVLQMGEDTLSCPRGKYIIYAWTQVSELAGTPEELLRPYLSALTSTTIPENGRTTSIEFSVFYSQREGNVVPTVSHPRTLLVPPLLSTLSEIADQSTRDAEDLFWDAVRQLGRGDDEIEAFWPPAEPVDEDTSDDWE